MAGHTRNTTHFIQQENVRLNKRMSSCNRS
jgi:hypothetical protein